jgi:hypothetical protein
MTLDGLIFLISNDADRKETAGTTPNDEPAASHSDQKGMLYAPP